MITWVRNADWVVAWDELRARHVYLRNADVVFRDDRIVFVGRGYPGPADSVIEGNRRLVMPGLVNVHTHLMAEVLGRGIIEELGNQHLYMSGLYDQKAVFLSTMMTHETAASEAATAARASTQLAVAELLKSGVTTVVDLAVPYDSWLDILDATGIRAYAAPMYRQARWVVPEGWRL